MATTDYSINSGDGWVKVSDDGVDFIMENKSRVATVKYTFASSAPSAGAPYHRVRPDDFAIRAGAPGDCYISVDSADDVTVTVS